MGANATLRTPCHWRIFGFELAQKHRDLCQRCPQRALVGLLFVLRTGTMCGRGLSGLDSPTWTATPPSTVQRLLVRVVKVGSVGAVGVLVDGAGAHHPMQIFILGRSACNVGGVWTSPGVPPSRHSRRSWIC